MGDVKNRIGPAGQFDLARQRFKALLLRCEVEGDLRQGLVPIALFLPARPIEAALPFATRRPAASIARTALISRAGIAAGWPAWRPGTALAAAVAIARTGIRA